MKHRFGFLLPILTLCLSSCASFFMALFDDFNLESTATTFYQESADDESLLLPLLKTNTYYHPDAPFIRYMDLETYAESLKRNFKDTVSFKFQEGATDITWQVYDGDSYIFVAVLSHLSSTLYFGGSLYSALPSNSSFLSGSSLGYASSSSTSVIEEGQSYYSYPYSSQEIISHYKNGKYYVPLGLLDMTLGQTCSIYHIVTPEGIVRYSEAAKLYGYHYRILGQDVPAMSSLYNHFNGEMPRYLINYERESFLNFMDNHYGFKKDLNIKSMKDYYSNLGYYDLMGSTKPAERLKGYSSALAIYGDLHTRLLNNAAVWGETMEGYTSSDKQIEHQRVKELLTDQRNAHFEDGNLDMQSIEYSGNGKTALFRFDSFSVCEDAYIGDDLKANAYLEDSFLFAKHQLDAIKTHGGVKNVVIDISLNTGGYVYVMQKILALLGNMASTVYTYSDFRGFINKQEVMLDHEKLGIDSQTYSDFNFYFLTSPVSFSCGNALPCFARHQGLAKTIGVNSGGGECTVETVCTPGAHYFCYSSDNRMVDYDPSTKQFYHLEQGAGIDISLDYDHFFDIEQIASKLPA